MTAVADASLLIAISFHFLSERLCYLEEVLHTLATFPVRQRNIVVFTNTTDPAEQKIVRQLFGKGCLLDGHDARLVVVTDLVHRYDLTWAHKKLITAEFLAPNSRYTHFVYLEDDERLTFENFVYFLTAREILRPFSLVPAFLRTEWSATRGLYVNTDNVSPVLLTNRPFVLARDYAFINFDNPYYGAFVLDQELAQEYVASRSFDPSCSSEVSPFDTRERAAMGLTFEAPPPPFTYRIVVPISIASKIPAQHAWLAHLPNNYADDCDQPFGKCAMANLCVGDFNLATAVRSPTGGSHLKKLNPHLEAVLKPFLDQSATLSSIVAIGCHRIWSDHSQTRESSELVGTDDSVLLQLVSHGDTDIALTACLPIPGTLYLHTLESLARHAQELSKNRAGDNLVLLSERTLEELIPPPTQDFGFRAVVTISFRRPTQPAEESAWTLQRTMFDRGFVKLCSVHVDDGEAHCFLASDAIRSPLPLDIKSRGTVTMSTLGTNGRFANQLFQYAYVKLYALRHGLKAALPAWEGNEYFGLNDPSCQDLALPGLRFGAFDDDDRILWEMADPPINIDLWGYFQELPKCWERQRPLLRRLFQLSAEHTRAIEAWRYDITRGGRRTLVAIHLRRGDYRDRHQGLPWFRIIPEDWYLAWLRTIWPTLRDPLLFVATDEAHIIRPIFDAFKPISANFGAPASKLPDHIRDFEVLRRADQLLICNSSFSRMAAILTASTQKVYCPSFHKQGFEPFEPWGDTNFWERFAVDLPESRAGSDITAVHLRGIDARLALGNLRQVILQLNQELQILHQELASIKQSRVWRTVEFLRKLMEKFPITTKSNVNDQ